MKNDEIRISITEEGVIKMETDKISMPNHSLAETFVKEIGRLAGGTTTRKSRHKHGHHGHHHHEGEQHEH